MRYTFRVYFRIISIIVLIAVVFADPSTLRPVPQDCKWSSWTEQGCSATCGADAMRRNERSKIQEASNGGLRCRGATIRILPCNLPECENLGNIGKTILLITLSLIDIYLPNLFIVKYYSELL